MVWFKRNTGWLLREAGSLCFTAARCKWTPHLSFRKRRLARAIIGLIPSDGSITIDGENVLQKRTKEQRKKVQIVFQDPLSSLNPTKKIGWILEEPLRIHRIGD